MLKHYIKFALRNFRSNKIIFGGSLVTLCLAALCIALLYSYVPGQLNMDGFHQRLKDIYAITINESPQSQPEIFEPHSYIGFNYHDYPELESLTNLEKYKKGDLKITYNNSTYSPEGVVTDSNFFEVFDFHLKIGDEATVLKDPDAILITENLAHKIFGDNDPMGKTLNVRTKRDKNFTVKGVLINPPYNSSIEFEFLLPEQYNDPNFLSKMGGSFILADKNFNRGSFNKKIKYLARENFQFEESTMDLMPFDYKEINKSGLQSLGLIGRTVNEKNLYLQIIIMLVILIISALNFSNLQVINTNSRVKNSALKMVNGAHKSHIIVQMLVELGLLVIVSTIIGTVAYQLILPSFMSFANIPISASLSKTILMMAAIFLVLSAIGLVYPLIVALRLPLVKSLKNQIFSQNQIKGRKAVVIFQYGLTLLLLISSIVVARQLQMMLHKDLGFHQKNIISAQIFGEPSNINSKEEYETFITKVEVAKNEMTSHSSIKSFAQGYEPMDAFTMDWKRKDGNFTMETHNTLIVSPNYDKVLGLQLVEGRFFDSKIDQSRQQKIVINEAAKRYWSIADINDSEIVNESWGNYKVIGVVKDFNYQHLSSTIQPLIMLYMSDVEDPFLIEFQEGASQSGLAFMEQFFKVQNPDETFSYSFLEDDVAALYEKEKQLSISYVLFTLIALIISAIGLFTIALYDARRRRKEIALRKVNGATVSEVLALLNFRFVKWVGLAFIISGPVSYLLMHIWLENFAYKTTLSWWIFAVAGITTLLIALVTVSWQSYRAAAANPANALRNE